MASAIYKITNTINGKVYIGQAVDVDKRWDDHISKLNNGKHYNSHMQNAWDKYGGSSFVFSVIEECEESQLSEREIFWIGTLNSYCPDRGYNKTMGGEGGKPTFETRVKMSKKKKGKPSWNKGRTGVYSPKTLEKMSESRKGKGIGRTVSHSLEIRKKISESLKGKLSRENNPASKLTEDQVSEIRSLLVAGRTQIKIADQFNVSRSTIRNIKLGISWQEKNTKENG